MPSPSVVAVAACTLLTGCASLPEADPSCTAKVEAQREVIPGKLVVKTRDGQPLVTSVKVVFEVASSETCGGRVYGIL